jgi:hypothetical protein
MFKAEQFLSDHHIDYTTTGKHARAGWVQIRCPACSGHAGWHGGINVEGSFYNCWRCGYHWMPKIISILLNVSIPQAKQLISRYSTKEGQRYRARKKDQIRPNELDSPPLLPHMADSHKDYLSARNFNPDHLQRVWGIKSTGYTGFYKHRIFIPVCFEWNVVSFQCLSPHRNPPYLGCSEQKEIIPHKHLVYGFDYAVEKAKCVLVEGVTDVWRLGAGAVACFGTGWTQEQIDLVCNNFDEVTVLLDADVPWKDKNKLAQNLIAHGVPKVDVIELKEGDPGDLTLEQSQELMNDLGF